MIDPETLTVTQLKKVVKDFKKIHCKPFSKLNRAGLIDLVKEVQSNKGKHTETPVTKAVPEVKTKSFGSTVSEQVENIKKTLSHGSIDRQKEAVRKALEILKYKENHIIQEARKPLQRELFLLLHSIKTKPKFTQYYLPSPTGGNTGSRVIDRSDIAKEIPVFQKSVVDIVEKEIKEEKKAHKKAQKAETETRNMETQKREIAERNIDVDSIIAKWGKRYGTSIIPKDELFLGLANRGMEDALDFKKKGGEEFTGYSSIELQKAFKNFWLEYQYYLELHPKISIAPPGNLDRKNFMVTHRVPTTVSATRQEPTNKLSVKQREKLNSLKSQLSKLAKPISGSSSRYYINEMRLREQIKALEEKR